ncbi:LD-carboxypeptidase [Synergistaceae bacterium OttesenSCG-928-I11]|nr:LD-carboxypeptidase [Synergistaceae bacterium OttesenSCG-928-I11]
MRLPKALTHDSRVAVLAPSSPAPAKKIDDAVQAIRSMGFEPVVYPSCTGSTPERGYLAAESDAVKISDIHAAFSDPSVDGILCMRGGSGAGRLIRHLDATLIAANPKVFVGYSDITILHAFIARNCGFVTFHGPMATTDDIGDPASPTRASLLRALTDPAPLGAVQNPDGRPLECLSPGRATGALVGGNLAVMCTTVGTVAEIDTKEKIVLIEDVDEEPYSIDRMLNHLINAGKLVDAAGIVLGSFTRCDPPERHPDRTVGVVFRDVLAPLGIPIVSGLDVGHDKTNLTLPLGAEVRLDADLGEIAVENPALLP